MIERRTLPMADYSCSELRGDGAARAGTHRGAGGSSRAELLRRAIVAGGALTGGGILIAGLAGPGSSAPSPAQDVRILNLVLLLEYLESSFYTEAHAKHAFKGELRQFVTVVGAHEREHVAYLKKALGARARKRPRFDFGDATVNREKFIAAATALEDTSVAAYNGQAGNLTPDALAAAATIVSVEARHAAWIRSIAGELPAAEATDTPKTEAEVMRALRKTGFLKAT
jgi:rubrerythrin